MTFQTDAPLQHKSLHAYNRQARGVASLVRDGDLDVAPPYQRPSVWTDTQRINLVRSWMLGIPVPAIMINDRGSDAWRAANGSSPVDNNEPSYVVIDGRQRVETAVAWFSGDLAVPASWFEADSVESTIDTDDGHYVTHNRLTLVAQRVFGNRAMLPTIEANVLSETDEADLFVLVNTGGTPQTEADIDHAVSYSSEM